MNKDSHVQCHTSFKEWFELKVPDDHPIDVAADLDTAKPQTVFDVVQLVEFLLDLDDGFGRRLTLFRRLGRLSWLSPSEGQPSRVLSGPSQACQMPF